MAAYRRVCDSHHLQADCQEPESTPEPYTLSNRVWATFTFFTATPQSQFSIDTSTLQIIVSLLYNCRTGTRENAGHPDRPRQRTAGTIPGQLTIAKFHYTDPTGPDRTGPDQTKSAHFVGDRLNSTTQTRPDPHGLFLRPGSPRNSVGSVRVSDKVRAGPCGSARVRVGPVGSGRARVVEFSLYATYSSVFTRCTNARWQQAPSTLQCGRAAPRHDDNAPTSDW